MKWPFALLLALSLAGCAESGNFEREKPIKLAAPAEPISPPTKTVGHKSLLARAEAHQTGTHERTTSASLMECVSEACKRQCSPGPEKNLRPKWCLYFKEPIASHASEIQGQSTE
jgi:hypothetical protein